MVDGRTTDGLTDDDGRRLDGYTISSPCEPNGSGELIITRLDYHEILHHKKTAFASGNNNVTDQPAHCAV